MADIDTTIRSVGTPALGGVYNVDIVEINFKRPKLEGESVLRKYEADWGYGMHLGRTHQRVSFACENRITEVMRDWADHFQGTTVPSPVSKDELADFQLEAGSGTVHTVLDHRALADGSQEFLIKWLGDYPSSWLAGREAKHIAKVKDYCREKQLPLPGEGVRAVAAAAAQGPQAARRGSDRRRTGGPH